MNVKNWLQTIQDNPKAANRLYDIMNHTLSSEDGEQVYVPTEELAEVYAILFTAWMGDASDLAQLMDNRRGESSRGYEPARVKVQIEDDAFTVEHLPPLKELGPGIWLEIDLY